MSFSLSRIFQRLTLYQSLRRVYYMNPAVSEFFGTTLSSIAATVTDGVCYTILILLSLNIAASAFIGSIAGGLVHFTLCRKFVFSNASTSKSYSMVAYFFMWYSGAAIHSFVVYSLSKIVGEFFAWPISRLLLFIFYVFPMNKYIVFGGLAPKIEKAFVRLFQKLSCSVDVVEEVKELEELESPV
ncbi:hypothetical protein GEMRC1_010278 [Eukaryota sp. GEM-RC1]